MMKVFEFTHIYVYMRTSWHWDGLHPWGGGFIYWGRVFTVGARCPAAKTVSGNLCPSPALSTLICTKRLDSCCWSGPTVFSDLCRVLSEEKGRKHILLPVIVRPSHISLTIARWSTVCLGGGDFHPQKSGRKTQGRVPTVLRPTHKWIQGGGTQRAQATLAPMNFFQNHAVFRQF